MSLPVVFKLCLLAIVFDILLNRASGAVPSQTVSCPREPSAEETAYCLAQSDEASTDSTDIPFFKRCVQDYFGLEPPIDFTDQQKKNFKKPQFDTYFKRPSVKFTHFEKTAKRIEKFFKRHNDWETTKQTAAFNNPISNLLSIANARYLYVTYLLYVYSDYKLKACQHEPLANKIKFIQSVCFLPPYGTTSATSDYDVGLIGGDSGLLASTFNTKFEATSNFGKPSEIVFDTNIYGYSLEYSMPSLFVGLSTFYRILMPKLDFIPRYQMLELAGAYVKMLRFHQSYYDKFKSYASTNLGTTHPIPDRKGPFDTWIANFERWDNELQFSNLEDLRSKHNARYGQILTSLQQNEVSDGLRDTASVARFVWQMSVALVYAAEAYHTKGAMRHVVGVIQLKNEEIKAGMTVMDYWVSMIENWADANKGFSHCGTKTAIKCLLSMSKYLYRTFSALKKIRNTLYDNRSLFNKLKVAFVGENPPYVLPDYPNHGKPCDPEKITKTWVYQYKGKRSEVPEREARQFFIAVGCAQLNPPQAVNSQITRECMDKIQQLIEAFDNLLVKTTAKTTTEDTVMYKRDGILKTRPIHLTHKE